MQFHSLKKTIFATMAITSLTAGISFAEVIPVTQSGDTTNTANQTTTSATATESNDHSSTKTGDTKTDKNTTKDNKATTPGKAAPLPGSLTGFPTRSVIIISQDSSHNKAFSDYMTDQLTNVFRYPYYNTSKRTQANKLGLNDLIALADQDTNNGKGADLYLSPSAKTDEYGSGSRGGFTGIYRKGLSDSDYKHTEVEGTLYYYDTQSKQSGAITKGFYGTEDALTMPSHQGVYKDVVDRMLNQLPYKRIPTDQPTYDPNQPNQNTHSTTTTKTVKNPDGTITTTTTTTTTSTVSTDTKGQEGLNQLNNFLKNPKSVDVNQLFDLLQGDKKKKIDLSSFLTI